MASLRYRTAGESHGPGILALLEGVPAGLRVDREAIDRALARRRGGYGRSARQAMETDAVEILAGVRRGATLGSPLALWIRNADARIDRVEPRSVPRPGHADLAGLARWGGTDVHAVAERASARETAGRVAAGAIAAQLLAEAGADVAGFVVAIGGGAARSSVRSAAAARRAAARSVFYGPGPGLDAAWRRLVDAARARGDTLGGVVEVRADGLPPGLGSAFQWDERLDGRLARALMSVQAIKGVEIGLGFAASALRGSAVHDPIVARRGRLARAGNRAGGLEGGMTNGAPLVLRAAMKPLSTLLRPLRSVDLATGRAAPATVIRSDVCAVPAAAVVCEAVVALEVASALLERTGAVTVSELRRGAAALRTRAPRPRR